MEPLLAPAALGVLLRCRGLTVLAWTPVRAALAPSVWDKDTRQTGRGGIGLPGDNVLFKAALT